MNIIKWQNRTKKDLRKIADKPRSAILKTVKHLQNHPNTWKNVRTLINHQFDYRLRVGNYRIFFNYQKSINIIKIERVKKRDENTY